MKPFLPKTAFLILVLTVLGLTGALVAAEHQSRTSTMSALVKSTTSNPQLPSSAMPSPGPMSGITSHPPSQSSALDVCNRPIDSTNTWTEYNNTDFGFSLSLDSLWSGYTTSVQQSDNGVDYIDLKIPEENTSAAPAVDYQTVLTVVAAPSAQWDYFLPLGGPDDYIMAPTFIGRNAHYIFGYFRGNGAPFGPLDVQCEITRIMNTFRILDR